MCKTSYNLKNICNMEEVWTFMEQEQSQVKEVTSAIDVSLMAITFSPAAKTEGQKFSEVFQKWLAGGSRCQSKFEIKSPEP